MEGSGTRGTLGQKEGHGGCEGMGAQGIWQLWGYGVVGGRGTKGMWGHGRKREARGCREMSLWGHVWLRDTMTPGGGWGQWGGDSGRGHTGTALRCSILSPSCVRAAGRAVPALGGSSPFPFCAETPKRHLPFPAPLQGALPGVGFLHRCNGNRSEPFHPSAFVLPLWLLSPKCPQGGPKSRSPLGVGQIPFPQPFFLHPKHLLLPLLTVRGPLGVASHPQACHHTTQLGVTQKWLRVH